MITVAIAVGPNPVYKLYMQECIDSLKNQTIKPDEVLVIDDMANVREWDLDWADLLVRIWESPWLLGVPHVYNFGVALAKNELVIILGCDDKLMPHAIEDSINTYYRNNKEPLAVYYFDLIYSDTGEGQRAACGCAMFTKSLWKYTGGYPIQTTIGACDHVFFSILMQQKEISFINIESNTPAYWYRRHDQNATAKYNIWPAIEAVKLWLNSNWVKPNWERYERSIDEQSCRRGEEVMSFQWESSRR